MSLYDTPFTFQQKVSYTSWLVLWEEDVGMVVGRQGRTINGIKNDLGLIELRVMKPTQASGYLPWVFIHGLNVMQINKAYTEVLEIARESMRRRLTEVPMATPVPVTVAEVANFQTVKNGKKVTFELETSSGQLTEIPVTTSPQSPTYSPQSPMLHDGKDTPPGQDFWEAVNTIPDPVARRLVLSSLSETNPDLHHDNDKQFGDEFWTAVDSIPDPKARHLVLASLDGVVNQDHTQPTRIPSSVPDADLKPPRVRSYFSFSGRRCPEGK